MRPREQQLKDRLAESPESGNGLRKSQHAGHEWRCCRRLVKRSRKPRKDWPRRHQAEQQAPGQPVHSHRRFRQRPEQGEGRRDQKGIWLQPDLVRQCAGRLYPASEIANDGITRRQQQLLTPAESECRHGERTSAGSQKSQPWLRRKKDGRGCLCSEPLLLTVGKGGAHKTLLRNIFPGCA